MRGHTRERVFGYTHNFEAVLRGKKELKIVKKKDNDLQDAPTPLRLLKKNFKFGSIAHMCTTAPRFIGFFHSTKL